MTFKDLGLVVIDEEQRFGVAHKERLKKLRKLVDVLTLTATPIPRTLHMSLAGVRDLSIIATPPEDRRAIRTFVMKFDPARGQGGHRDTSSSAADRSSSSTTASAPSAPWRSSSRSSCPRRASGWPTARWARASSSR